MQLEPTKVLLYDPRRYKHASKQARTQRTHRQTHTHKQMKRKKRRESKMRNKIKSCQKETLQQRLCRQRIYQPRSRQQGRSIGATEEAAAAGDRLQTWHQRCWYASWRQARALLLSVKQHNKQLPMVVGQYTERCDNSMNWPF